MIEIQVAGAGAGKTYSLAERLSQLEINAKDNKLIYAITYTNSAKNKIKNTLIDLKGFNHQNIIVETIHSFLLNEIIYPYSSYILNEIYTKSVSFPLPVKPQFKNFKKKQLREYEIIHNEDVFKKSKIIIDVTNSKHSNRNKRRKVNKVIELIKSRVQNIFIDEVQDLDEDTIKVFDVLGNAGLNIYMVGDPKQAIKFNRAFSDYINQCIEKKSKEYNILKPINNTRRVPSSILSISNLFCPEGQIQSNIFKKTGSVSYCFGNKEQLNNISSNFLNKQSLIYIEKSHESYLTKKNNSTLHLPVTLEDKIRNLKKFRHLDSGLFLESILLEIKRKSIILSPKAIISEMTSKYEIDLSKPEYAELIQNLEKFKSLEEYEIVSSIDSVKGLESDLCVFILNENMFNYLFKKITKAKYHNKIWNKLYVALTRTSNELIFFIDMNLFSKTNLSEIEASFASLEISKLDLENTPT